MRFQDIPKMTQSPAYRVNQSWRHLEKWLEELKADFEVVLDPDYQRGHVWTEAQEIRYVEWILRGGQTGKEIHFNSKGWRKTTMTHPVELVDGKQRLKAVLRFLRNEIPAFGVLYKDYTDKLPLEAGFVIFVNDLDTRREVLQWYVDMNAGGTVHAPEEIERVRALIAAEPEGK